MKDAQWYVLIGPYAVDSDADADAVKLSSVSKYLPLVSFVLISGEDIHIK